VRIQAGLRGPDHRRAAATTVVRSEVPRARGRTTWVRPDSSVSKVQRQVQAAKGPRRSAVQVTELRVKALALASELRMQSRARRDRAREFARRRRRRASSPQRSRRAKGKKTGAWDPISTVPAELGWGKCSKVGHGCPAALIALEIAAFSCRQTLVGRRADLRCANTRRNRRVRARARAKGSHRKTRRSPRVPPLVRSGRRP
jgi:hypothetical protein